MTQFLYANNAATTLAGPIASNATTINLAAGTGALFPNPGVGQQFAVTLISAANPNVLEIAYCTGRAVDTLTVVRAQEGTTATSFIAGDLVDNDLTAGTCAAFIQISQLQQEAPNYGVDTGSVNALQVTLTPQPGSLALISGSPIRVLVRNTNTSATTLTITGLPTTTVVTQEGLALPAGTIVGGQIFEFFYNPGIGFEVSSPLMLLGRATNAWTGNQTVGGTLTVSGAGGFQGPLTVLGTASLATLTVNGVATVGGNLGVQGALTVLGNTVLASLGVNGAATINNNLGVTGVFTCFSTGSFSGPVVVGNASQPAQAVALGQFATDNFNYTYLPNGWLFQWGAIPSLAPGGAVTVNFPIPFPAHLSSLAIGGGASQPGVPPPNWLNENSLSGFTASNSSLTVQSQLSTYIAIGR